MDSWRFVLGVSRRLRGSARIGLGFAAPSQKSHPPLLG